MFFPKSFLIMTCFLGHDTLAVNPHKNLKILCFARQKTLSPRQACLSQIVYLSKSTQTTTNNETAMLYCLDPETPLNVYFSQKRPSIKSKQAELCSLVVKQFNTILRFQKRKPSQNAK